MKKIVLLFMALFYLVTAQGLAGNKTDAKASKKPDRGNRNISVLVTTPDMNGFNNVVLSRMEQYPGIHYTVTNALGALTVEEMLSYDVVWAVSILKWDVGTGTTAEDWSNKLGAYIDAGGKLLESHGVNRQGEWGLTGGSYMTGNKSPFTKATLDRGSENVNSGVVAVPSHPIMNGIGTIISYKPLQDVTVRPGATLICSWDNSFQDPFIAINNNVVATNACPILNPYMGIIIPGVSDDGYKMFHNALVWLHSQNVGPLGHLQGSVVDAQGSPMEGVTISLDNSSTTTTSNEQGEFSFHYLTEGSHSFTASFTGYANANTTANITANQTSNITLVMNSISTVTLNGVIKSEQNTAIGLQGAIVKLSGYAAYQTTTGADGSFSIPGVFGNQNYNILVEAPAHKPYSSTVAVPNTNTTLPEIVLQLSHIIDVTVGQDLTYPAISVNIPFDFNNKHSFSQTIYYPSELGVNSGAILGISYKHNFYSDVENRTIRIWMGETQKQNFQDDEWIDPSTLTLVYEGPITVPAGEGTININFNDHYVYHGGNLVVYTQRVFEDFYYMGEDRFYSTLDAGSMRTKRTTGGDSNQGTIIPPAGGTVIDYFPNSVFHIYTNQLGSIAGTVSNGGSPIENVKVQVEGKQIIAYTNANGEYALNEIIPDTYDVNYTLFGFENHTESDIEIEPGQAMTLNVSMTAIGQKTVIGIAKGNDGALLGNAIVKLEGYENYETTTDANGAFNFPSVYSGSYTLTISATGYEAYQALNLMVDDNLNLGELILTEIILTPGALYVDVDGQPQGKALFSWYPSESEFRHDDGTVVGQIGVGTGGTFNSVFGSVHRNNALLSEVSWYLTNEGGPHDTIKVWIFGLDENGNPDRTDLLFSQEYVQNTDMQWNTLQLPHPVDAPNGFLIGLSYEGFLGLGKDDGINEWPFHPNTHYYVQNVTTSAFAPIESFGNFIGNFLIRATGVDRGELSSDKTASPIADISNPPFSSLLESPIITENPAVETASNASTKNFTGYNVYLDESLVASGVNDTHYLFTDLEEGSYTAGVQAVFSTGNSEIVSLDFNMIYRVNVTINVTTNSGDSPEGALVVLKNNNFSQYQYTAQVGANGQVVFEEVQPGTYTLKITKTAFEDYKVEDLVINSQLIYPAQLTEKLSTVYGVIVDTDNQQDGSAHVSWNNIIGDQSFSDSFEDGSINAWGQFIQGPGTPGVPGGFAYWYATNQPSGDIAPDGQYVAKVNWGNNIDTWLITPTLFVNEGSAVTFNWYGSYTWSVNPNPNAQLMIKVSNDGGQTWDEIWNWQDIGVWDNFIWYETTIGLEEYVHQSVLVAFHLIGNDNGVTQIDNVRIGASGKNGTQAITSPIAVDPFAKNVPQGIACQKSFSAYNVYLDNMFIPVAAGLNNTECLFNNLEEGNHTVGIQTIYTSGFSEIVTKEFQITDRVNVTFDITTNTSANTEGAIVKLNNNNVAHYAYEGVVSSDNQLIIQGVRKGNYTLGIELEGFNNYLESNLVIDNEATIDVELIETINKPFGLEVSWTDVNYGEAQFKWNVPQQTEFRYDDGMAIGALGSSTGTLNTVLGSAHRHDAQLTQMSWYLTDMGGPHSFIKVWVFGLDENGNPDPFNVLYSQENVPNVDLQWNTHVFPTPVNAPNGFFLGVSYEGFVAIGRDSGIGNWPFQPNTHFVVGDVATENFVPVETVGEFPNNFMIRAMGYDNGALNSSKNIQAFGHTGFEFIGQDLKQPINTSAPEYISLTNNENSKQLLSYNVFLNNMDTPVATVENAEEYLFSGLSNGNYTAGVQSVYSSGVSEIVTKTFNYNHEIPVFNVTFRAHFHYYQDFDPASDVVYISGSMFNWADPGSDPDNQTLVVSNEDPMVYTKTLALPIGTYQFKYALNEGWDGAEWTGEPNRSVTITSDTIINNVFGNINDPVGIPETSNALIKLFPNPASDILLIQSDKQIKEIRIFNMLGQEVFAGNPESIHLKVSVSHFTNGMYFVRILTQNGLSTYKVQVNK